MGDPFGAATLRFCHGGVFKNVNNGELVYEGGKDRTFDINPDELCWWDLEDLAKRCGKYDKVEAIYYMVPGLRLVNGLRKVFDDKEVLELAKAALKYRYVEMYVSHDVKLPQLEPMELVIQKTHFQPMPQNKAISPIRKLPPRRGPLIKEDAATLSFQKAATTSTSQKATDTSSLEKDNPTHGSNQQIPDELDSYFEERGEEKCDSEQLDEDGLDLESEEEVNEEDVHEECLSESENTDDEYMIARERVRVCKSKLVDLAHQLQREAAEGTLGAQQQTAETQEGPSTDFEYISEYEESGDEIHTPPDSGEEDLTVGKKRKIGVLVSPNTDFSKFKWMVGQRFATRKDFKRAVANYAIFQGRNVSIVVSNKNRQQRLGIKCVKGCPFYLYSAWDTRRGTLVVRRVDGVHTCHRNMKKNRQLKSTWVAEHFLDVFKAKPHWPKPHWPAKEIMETIRRAYKVVVKKDFAYKVKYAAHKMLHGSMHDHYKKILPYLQALKDSSPGTQLDLVTDMSKQVHPPVFQRLFTCFEGLHKGWVEGCRKVICVDACFLKTFLGGQLLSAVGRDGNDQMYPIAWAVVEGENNLSWEWFFVHIQKCLLLGKGEGIAIISDEHQSIINAVASVLPKAEHRHCARHIFALWHKSFRGDEMKQLFWKIAKAYNMADYNDSLEELTSVNMDAATAFQSYNPKLFCRAFLDTSMRTDAITNNMAETFNGYIINARTKHLLYMLEDIRAALMQRLVIKRQEMEKSTSNLCPRIQARLEREKIDAANCDVLPSTDTLFNVSYYLDQLVVDLEARTCTCRKWEMLGIPCCHAIACIYFQHKEAEDFVDDCYMRDTYLKAYSGSIPPCEGERHWPRTVCHIGPPPIKIGPGRPRKNRRKDPFEDPKKPGILKRIGMEMTCNICQMKGHNKRRCPNKDIAIIRELPPKRARGRPRNDGQPPNSQTSRAPALTSTHHHSATAQPSQLGRNGRMVRGGMGSRGGRGANRGRGKGRGRNQVPVGIGIYIASDGSALTNLPDSAGPSSITEQTFPGTQSSQVST